MKGKIKLRKGDQNFFKIGHALVVSLVLNILIFQIQPSKPITKEHLDPGKKAFVSLELPSQLEALTEPAVMYQRSSY